MNGGSGNQPGEGRSDGYVGLVLCLLGAAIVSVLGVQYNLGLVAVHRAATNEAATALTECLAPRAEKRDAVHRALIVAIMALAHHHGLQGPDLAFTLYRLRTIAEREAASPGSCEAIRKLVEVEQELKRIYETARPNPTPLLSELDRLLADLETAGWVLQERNPVQITEQRYRTLLRE